jgi:hypothetical protein
MLKLINCGTGYNKIFLETLKNRFWIDVLKSWLRFQNLSQNTHISADAPLFLTTDRQVDVTGISTVSFDVSVSQVLWPLQ